MKNFLNKIKIKQAQKKNASKISKKKFKVVSTEIFFHRNYPGKTISYKNLHSFTKPTLSYWGRIPLIGNSFWKATKRALGEQKISFEFLERLKKTAFDLFQFFSHRNNIFSNQYLSSEIKNF